MTMLLVGMSEMFSREMHDHASARTGVWKSLHRISTLAQDGAVVYTAESSRSSVTVAEYR